MVVFPSWLPFFLTQSPQDAKQNAAHEITAGRKKRTQYATTKDAKVYTESLNKLKTRLGITAAHAPNLS